MNSLRICFLALLLMVSVKVGAQSIYLLSVGVSDYPGDKDDLVLSDQDAIAMHRLYQQNANATSVLLTNTLARKSRILSEANRLYSKAKPNDIVVFYFSGHGNKGGYYAYDAFLRYDEIRRIFSQCPARNKMIFADACHSGDMRDNAEHVSIDTRHNVMLFLSSRDDEFSNEVSIMRNGFFTACLLRSLKGGADMNRDRIITAKELFTAVSQGVRGLSQNTQHPVMWGNFDDTMPVMIWK